MFMVTTKPEFSDFVMPNMTYFWVSKVQSDTALFANLNSHVSQSFTVILDRGCEPG
jgi:hypothetical protein